MSENKKSIFITTIELIGSIMLGLLFITLLYGMFSGDLESMLWNAFYKFVDILKPILAFVGLIIFVLRGIPTIVSFFDSLIEEMRQDRESIAIWNQFESSPTPSSPTQNNATQTIPKHNSSPLTQSRGGVTYTEVDGIMTGTFNHKDYNTLEGLEPGSKKAQEVYKNSEERAERLARIYELEKKIQEVQKNSYANEKLKSLKPKFEINEERTTDVQLIDEE